MSKRGRPPVDAIEVHVGARLRLRRASLGLTMAEVAEALGCTYQQISKYENGVNRPSISALYRLSRLFDVEVSYFFEGLGEKGADGAQVMQAELRSLRVARRLQLLDDEVKDALMRLLRRVLDTRGVDKG